MLGPLLVRRSHSVEQQDEDNDGSFLLAQAGRLPIGCGKSGQRALLTVLDWYRRRDWEFRELSG